MSFPAVVVRDASDAVAVVRGAVWSSVAVRVVSSGVSAVRPGVWDVVAVCEDGSRRVCRVFRDRLSPSALESARGFVRRLRAAVSSGEELVFAAAGGNSERRWFCDIAGSDEVVRLASAEHVAEIEALLFS